MVSAIETVISSIQNQWIMLAQRDDISLSQEDVISMLSMFRSILYPQKPDEKKDISSSILDLNDLLINLLKDLTADQEAAAARIIQQIPDLILALNKDVEAIYAGDPSAKSRKEIILCYPGFQAVFGYRIANLFYRMNVPLLPRMISEYYHSITGIDIHPGASIGNYFCIDHGTGIVIGETATIGDRVRIYHGVTLGVKNFRKDEQGNLLKGYKRHPDVGNDVVIYANATVMGNITLGDRCIIGANAVVTRNVGNDELVKFEREEIKE